MHGHHGPDVDTFSRSHVDTLIVRTATPADVSAIASLIEASVRGLGPPHYDAEQIESSLVHLFGVDTAMIEDGTYLVAEDQGAIVGAGGWSRRKTPFGGDQAGAVRDAGLRDPAVDPAILRAFYVHPDVARRGVGRLLMDAAEAGARAAGFARYELVSTLPGLAFYRKCGYVEVEPLEIPLPDGVVIGAVRMVKG
jgi:predicted N-acetyltransferase YhbS